MSDFPELYLTPNHHLYQGTGGKFFIAGKNGAGLLELLKMNSSEGLPPTYSFFRKFAREFIEKLCRFQTVEEKDLRPIFEEIRSNDDDLTKYLLRVPPMRGGEYLNLDFLKELQADLEVEIQDQYRAFEGPLALWLRSVNPIWKNVGKVSFHLAENKKDPDGNRPFALLATFIYRLSDQEKPKHLPLSTALKVYAGDSSALDAILAPIQAAAEKSAFIKQLVESRRIFVPTALTVAQAHVFLKEIPLYESLNILVRITNLWRTGHSPKANVGVKLDVKKSGFDTESLLKFDVQATLDGEPLTEKELETLVHAQEGLVRIRGQWVEADGEKIQQLLAEWKNAKKATAETGISFFEGLRLLAGAGSTAKGLPYEFDSEYCTFEASGELRKMLDSMISPSEIKLPRLPVVLKKTLRPYQLDGVKYLWGFSKLSLGACLADDMGLGKTLQVLTFLQLLKTSGELKERPALLVLPATLLTNWKQEAEKFTPGLKVGILHPSARTKEEMDSLKSAPENVLKPYDVVLTTYGLLHRLTALQNESWPVVIADEAQAIKTPSTRQSKAVRSLKSRRKIALTGTPVENSLMDLWTLFDFINPGLLGNQTSFKDFIKSLNSSENEEENEAEKYAPLRKLTRPFILRRLKTDRSIIADLPDKTELKVYCSLAKKQAAAYQLAVKELKAALEETDEFGQHRRGVILQFLLRFKQICNHPSQFDGCGDYDPDWSGKFRRLGELVEPIYERQEKLLVFTQFREMTGPIHDYLARIFGREGLILHGGTSVKKRPQLVEAFQREDGPPFFVLSLKAAGTGLNLTAANHVIHFDRWWNPAVENQATDRAFRIGQQKNVLVHKFICRGTLEEKIDALISGKQALSDSILTEGAEKLLTNMTNAELMDFVKLDLKSVE